MQKQTWLAGLALLALTGGAWAQATDERESEETKAPVKQIRVLENPYEIASFYRSSQSSSPRYFSYQSPYDFSDRYPIAGYYRQQSGGRGYGYGTYWNNRARRPRLLVGLRHRLGAHNDLFLVAPTFLAPIGPLTSAYYGD